ncbi:MAG: hypothetical protein V1891_00765 [bacterium]
MDNSNNKIKHSNPGDSNNFDSYMDEVPVKNINGGFDVVKMGTDGKEAEEGKDGIKKQELGIRNGEPSFADRALPKRIFATARAADGKEIEKLREGKEGREEIKKLQPPAPVILKNNKPVFMISAEDEEEVRGLFAEKREGEEEKEGIEGRERGEGIKIREIEQEKRNMGVNLYDLASKRNEVERDVEEKVGEIMEEIRNCLPAEASAQAGKLEIGEGLCHPIRLSLRASSEGATEERLKDPVAYTSHLGILRPPGARAQNDALYSRLKNLLRTRIKGARNNIQLWQMLIKRSEEGGIGMSEKEADEVIKIISGELEKKIDKKEGKEEKDGGIKNYESGIMSRDEGDGDTDLTQIGGEESSKLKARPELAERIQSEKLGEAGEEDKFQILKKEGKEEIEGKEEKEGEDIRQRTAESRQQGGNKTPQPLHSATAQDRLFEKGGDVKNNFYSLNRSMSNSGKAKIEDIKYKPKLMGPVEEIGAMRLNDFRSLSPDPHHAAEIIKSRIDGLEEESFSKKMEGIAAWRASEIYKTYLEIGRRAMVENMSIKKVCDELKENGENYLSEEEFNGVMDLNKKLRF